MPTDPIGTEIAEGSVAPAVDLKGKVAVVTGASRSIGKGIALELGAAGATVYVTGRTVEPGAMPGTVGETAAEIDALGGAGIGVACDHKDDAQVKALFERVAAEQGHLDVLVNNVFPAPVLAPWLGQKFWDLPIEAWDEIVGVGTRSHYVASVHTVQRGQCLLQWQLEREKHLQRWRRFIVYWNQKLQDGFYFW